MDDVREAEKRILYRGESAVVYCANFTNSPEVLAGASISSPAVAIIDGSALVTFGTPSVNTSTFTEYDEETGNVAKTVAAGKGVVFTITPGSTKGQCTALCSVIESINGSRIGVPMDLQVK